MSFTDDPTPCHSYFFSSAASLVRVSCVTKGGKLPAVGFSGGKCPLRVGGPGPGSVRGRNPSGRKERRERERGR